MSDDPNRLRHCRSTHPDDPTMQCQGEVTDLTTHIEDHWHSHGGITVRWSHVELAVANPERTRVDGPAGRCQALFGPGGVQCDRAVVHPASHTGYHQAGAVVWTSQEAYFPSRSDGPSARDQQVGGDHYRKHAIQVWDIVDEYGLSYYAGLALKYLLRAGDKGPKAEDLRKARHVLDRMIEKEE